MSPAADRNLLFGILAVQNDFIDDSQLIAALHEWKRDPHQPLGEILTGNGAIAQADRDALDQLVERNLARHANNPEQSIARLPTPPHLRRSVNQALGADSPFDADATVTQVTKPGESIRYAKESLHREGGLGAVFKAEDTELRRMIALKEIKPKWADDPASKESFLKEAEITGKLEHPGIVPVYGLGVYADQRPYYAMRFIEGRELKEVIEDFHKSKKSFDSVEFRSLLDSFIAACNAIAYAHSRGIIHRDIKPQNILIGPFGETLVVDWGLAKVVGRAEATDGTGTLHVPAGSDSSRTIAGDIKGTPAYMAPEQAQGRINELGPAADIYGLGATLYHLLVGQHAFAGKNDEPILNRVMQGSFPSPRSMNPDVPKPLEAVCLKAMAREPGERYPSAAALVADLKRHLADEPVSAACDPLSIRAKRWARKHPGTVAALAASLLVGTVGLAGGLFFVNAEKSRTETQRLAATRAREDEAEQRALAELKRAEAELARDAEAKEKRFAQAIAAFVRDDFLALMSVEGQARFGGDGLDRNATLGLLLDRAATKLQDRKDLDPFIDAELNWIVGVNLRAGGEPDRAIPFLERAVRLRDGQLTFAHSAITIRNSLAVAYQAAGRPRDATRLLKETLDHSDRQFGRDHPRTWDTLENLGWSEMTNGDYPRAMELLEEAARRRKAGLGPDHPDTLRGMCPLAECYRTSGRNDLALPLFEDTLARQKAALGLDHLDTIQSMNGLGLSQSAAGKFELAIPLLTDAMERSKARSEPNHPRTLNVMATLAESYALSGRNELALPLFERTLELRKSRLGPYHPDTLRSMGKLAASYKNIGKYDQALPMANETLKARKEVLGTEHPDTLAAMNNLAETYRSMGREDLAIPILEKSLTLSKKIIGPNHPNTLMIMNNLAESNRGAGNPELAVPIHADALKRRIENMGPSHPGTLMAMNNLGQSLRDAGRFELALPLQLETLGLMRTKLGPDHPDTLAAMNNLATSYRSIGRNDLALETFEQTAELMQARLGFEHPMTRTVRSNLRSTHLRVGNLGRFLSLAKADLGSIRNTRTSRTLDSARALVLLGTDYLSAGEWENAEEILMESLAIRQELRPDDWATFNAKSLIGEAQIRQGKTKEAEANILQGYEGLKGRANSIPPQGSTRLWEAAWRVSQYYEAIGDEANAAEWLKKEGNEQLPMPKPKIVPKTLAEVYEKLGIKP